MVLLGVQIAYRQIPLPSGNISYHLVIFLTILMDFDQPLDSVLGSRGSMALIRALVDLPPGLSVSARDLARRAGVSHPTALSVADKLYAQGLISVRREPKRDAYSLNRDHVLADKLSELFEWEDSLRDALFGDITAEVRKLIPGVRLVVLFGSAVASTLKVTSDIDLFLLVPEAPDLEARMTQLEDVIRARFGNRLSVISSTLTKNEFVERAPRNPVWRRILAEGQQLVGDL